MDRSKLKQSIIMAACVSLASQVSFNFLVPGFIIAMSVLVMEIFIYCYDKMSALYIAFCSGIFSPLLRLLINVAKGEALDEALYLVLPDMVFFFSYGLIFTFIYKYIVRGPKNIRNFSFTVMFCDILSNICELSGRSIISGTCVISFDIITYLMIVAICRTLMITMIVYGMEEYSNLLVRKEHDREYRRLIIQASLFETELHLMKKNASDVEQLMRDAYNLYKSLDSMELPPELKEKSLDISKNAHEVKADYINVINALQETFVSDIDETKLSIDDIVNIEKASLMSIAKDRNWQIEIITRIRSTVYVRRYFKMMSIIRNLMNNAAEALVNNGTGSGKIIVTLRESGDKYLLSVWDNGPGIEPSAEDDIYISSYSTKFNPDTGDIQRGMGLTIVKDYVENIFEGSISVDSKVGSYTEFLVQFPKATFEEGKNEVLYS